MREYISKNRFQVQTSRADGRGQHHKEVWESLRIKGFVLSHVPMSVCLLPDGNYHLMNGRTRTEELIRNNFTNLIVDVYESDDYMSFLKFAVFSNPPEDPHSAQTMRDVIELGIDSIGSGRLKPKDVYDFVDVVTSSSYSPSKVGEIVNSIIAGESSTSLSLNSTEAAEWLNINGYRDNMNGNGIYYCVVSYESPASSITSVAKQLKSLITNGNKVKEYRLVINPGTLKGGTIEKSWKGRIDRFRDGYISNLDSVRELYFGGTEIKNTIKLYGAIPTVKALAQEYPLDKLVIFAGPLKTKNFKDIDTENGLSKLMEVEEY